MYGVLENFENLILFTFPLNSQIPKGIIKRQKKRGFRSCFKHEIGELAEWLKAHAWKACILEMVSRVRIPYSPLNITLYNY